MNSTNYSLTKYEADEGKYFDWKVPRYRDVIGEDGQQKKILKNPAVKALFDRYGVEYFE